MTADDYCVAEEKVVQIEKMLTALVQKIQAGCGSNPS
jgi:hypothetical protein